MVTFRADDVFFHAFEKALNIAKQYKARITVVKVVDYPMGLGLDEGLVMDAAVRGHALMEFESILPKLQSRADMEQIHFEYKILDLRLSVGKAFVEYANKNNVDLMIVGAIKKEWWQKIFSTDVSEEILSLQPLCDVSVVYKDEFYF